MKIKILMLGLFVVMCTSCVAPPPTPKDSKVVELRFQVGMVANLIYARKYRASVEALFGVKDPREIALAKQHLDQSQTLELYQKLFATLMQLEPIMHESELIAVYRCDQLVLSYTTVSDMEVLFYFDGTGWRLDDPSFDRMLGRRLMPSHLRAIQKKAGW